MKKINTQRILLTTLVAVAFFGFLLWSIQQSQSEEETLTNTSLIVNISSPLENEMIKIASLKINSEIKSPITVSGQANLAGNKLKIRLRDGKGLLLKESFVQTNDAKKMSDFSINLAYKKPSAPKGTMETFLVTKDNSEIYRISIPVIFKD